MYRNACTKSWTVGGALEQTIYDVTGKLVVTNIPTSQQIVKLHTGIMANLGYYIKSSEIMEFKEVVRGFLDIEKSSNS